VPTRHHSAYALLFALAAAVATVSTVPAQQPAAIADPIRIPFERYLLANGLTVILAPNHTTPTVAVDVWYHVGSKNESKGRTGFAHLFEHVMFTGSGHVPYGVQDRLTEGVGGGNNATTSNDRTDYYDTVPSNFLESTLWIESDRMGFLLDALDSSKINAQRDIVINERRQRQDNAPYGAAYEILNRTTYPPSNPYSWDVIGSVADLRAASDTDVKDFFRRYYAPNNATLTIAGDFDPAQAKTWVAKYFSGIAKGAAIARPDVSPVTLPAPVRLVYEDRVQLPRLYIQWPTVGEKSDDRFALDVLGSILAGRRTARLTKALVYDQQAAATVNAGQDSNENAGQFLIVITPRPGHTLTELEQTVDTLIARLKTEGPSAEEVRRATAGTELDFVRGLESNLGKAEILASGEVFHGDAGYFRTEYQKSTSVTADEVKRVANQYLTAGRVVLSIVPAGQTALAARADESRNITAEQHTFAGQAEKP